MRVNVFEGARRILRLIQALWVLGVFAFALLTTPYVSADYYSNGPLVQLVRAPPGFTCDSDSAREWEFRNTPKGTRVSASLCFQATTYPGGRMLVSYKVGPDMTLFGNDNYSSEVTAYTRQRARDFQLPEADLAGFDKQGWDSRVENFMTGLYAAVIGVVVLSVLALIIGWIVRGFAGIPMRRAFTRPNMTVDTSLVLGIAQAILLLVIGAVVNRIFERRVRLVVYYGHVGVFKVDPSPTAAPGAVGMTIHTHTIVLRNAGGLPAHNVRVPHRGQLAPANIHFSVEPPLPYAVRPLPRGEDEIVFSLIAPKQQLTISYLYFPPITWSQINLQIMGDEGVARVVEMLPTPQLPRWALTILWALVVVGLGAVVYSLVELGRWTLR